MDGGGLIVKQDLTSGSTSTAARRDEIVVAGGLT
jgi:hypothetical protein